ncbi:MAG: acyl-CoA dehydrogenase family protein [Albidovulum sp.]|nr:acyl-CoA dehydrogenase family protein [Albidovulum sp.]
MNLGKTERLVELHERVVAMIRDEIRPLDAEFLSEVEKDGRWVLTKRQHEILDTLKSRAKRAGLWNLWLSEGETGNGLTTVEYAYLAEEMGKSHLAPEVFNCNAPDTGNMELLRRFGNDFQKAHWLSPLLNGDIRSAFLMTEPDVASSDATNISMTCEAEPGGYRLNGEKWWATGAGDPRCSVYIVMVRTSSGGARHQNHSMVLVPAGSEGIEKLRPMEVYGHDDAPHGHMHIRFDSVHVPKENLIAEEGQGFKIAQGRLGPGRIHHCMRAIGQAEFALEMLCRRSISRRAFGQPLAKLGQNYDIIANARSEIDMARLLCLKTAWKMDQGDDHAAAPWISKIKVVAPEVALRVTDHAIQMHGAAGISQDTPLARQWTHLRTLRLADGPDAVHRRQVARAELRKYSQENL